jgi:hypothetical protein
MLLKPGAKLWVDVLLLILFGVWSLLFLLPWFLGDTNAGSYVCSGPGPADFGCMGGWEAVAAGSIRVLSTLVPLGIFLIAICRIVNRSRK